MKEEVRIELEKEKEKLVLLAPPPKAISGERSHHEHRGRDTRGTSLFEDLNSHKQNPNFTNFFFLFRFF